MKSAIVALRKTTPGAQTGLRVVGPADEVALEAALRLREAGLLQKVVATCVGKLRAPCDEALRAAVAMGADAAFHIDAPSDSPLSVAMALQYLVARLGSDADAQKHENSALPKSLPQLVLLGQQSADTADCQVPQLLAGLLGWPQAMFVAALDRHQEELHATCESDSAGTRVVKLRLPAVVGCTLRLNTPRVATLQGILRSRKAAVVRLTLPSGNSSALSYEVLQTVAAPARARKHHMAKTPEALIAALRADSIF